MGIIKAVKLGFDYLRYDEDGNVQDTQRAVDNVDLDIQAGEFVAVLGHNGSGKSTFAKHINALLLPTEGTIWIDGMDTAKEPELWKIRQKAGMVFQNPDNQIIGTVVEEDVGFGPENMGIPTDDIWKRVDESLLKTGMSAYRHHSPNKLSGGQKQRVAIAGVMAMRPQCIVLDEPTAGLDVIARDSILELLREYMETEGRSILISSHISSDLESLCDDIYMIDKGRIVLHENTDVLLDEYGLIKADEKQYELLDKQHILKVKKEQYGYSCLTDERAFYAENYPQLAIERGSVDKVITMMIKGEVL